MLLLRKSGFPVLLLMLCLCPVRGAKRALVVGISTYPPQPDKAMTWHAIHGVNDALLMRPVLQKQGFSVTTLLNRQATAAAIRQALHRLARQAHAGDLIYIHFSGHGQPVADLNGDEADGWDEAIVPYDAARSYKKGVYDGRNHIIDDELSTLIGAIRKRAGRQGYVYVVVDACHSGGISKGEEEQDSLIIRGSAEGFSATGKRYVPPIDTRPAFRVEPIAGAAGVCFIEACRAYQNNYELRIGHTYYGALTYAIHKILSTHRLSRHTAWTRLVQQQMDNDLKASTKAWGMRPPQNIVIEQTAQ